MLKTHLVTGMACAFLGASLLPAQEVERRPIPTPERPQTERPERPESPQADQEKIGAGEKHLTDALAQWLVHGNKAEVELGQLAQQKASSQEVKQFAQKMVKEHTALIQKLQKFTDERETPIAGTESREQQRPETQPGQRVEERVAGFRGDNEAAHAAMEKIGKKAGEIHLKMTKELLNEYQGQEFDMAYIGQQISAHSQMLANLKAMEEHTTGEFQTVVKEGIQATEQHFKEAKQLSDQLQKRPGGQNRAIERPQVPEGGTIRR